ncbi:MAG: carbon starvation protein A [Thermoguttaceae bacterium]|nr:carbon starvation protein A [Thermoguttaceae bacterium]
MPADAALVAVVSFALLILAYFTYGRFIARRVYQLQGDRATPAHTLEDGVDYVPTRVPILFGHHFASIAGLGPILGPAVAVIWGWLPAVLWVVIGSIFIGAVHDLGALTVSLRYKGRSVGEVCLHVMGPRARLLALLIIFFLMSLAMGAFVNAISSLFVNFNPDAIIPSFGLMVVAMAMGVAVYKLNVPLVPATVMGLAAFAALIFWGVEQPVATYQWFTTSETREALAAERDKPEVRNETGEVTVAAFESPYGAAAAGARLTAVGNIAAADDVGRAVQVARYWWIGALLAYGFLASVLPVWLLLQPRDYINSFQLYFALATMVLGLLMAAATGAPESRIDAEAFRPNVSGALPWFPFLFVTIACGAVSGFHSLVSSGTTVKQLNRQTDALPIGYGGMLTEAALAILVILACAAGLGAVHWQAGGVYSSWGGIQAGGLGTQLSAVVRGGANFLTQIGIPTKYGMALLAVTIVAFALTTLDSATRLLRFNVEEICRSIHAEPLANRYFASAVAVGGIAFFGLVPVGTVLWVLFGTTNQLLAGLTLLVVSVFLFKLRRPIVYTLVPMILMLVVSIWAMVLSMIGFWTRPEQPWRWALIGVTAIVLAMSLWLMVEAMLSFAKGRGGLDEDGEPAGVRTPPPQ